MVNFTKNVNFSLYICSKLNKRYIMIVQRHKITGDRMKLSEVYFGVLSALNNLKLTRLEIGILAYMTIHGSISDSDIQDGVCKRYGTTSSTVNNTVSKLKKASLIIKKENKNVVNPFLVLDFSKDITLAITLDNNETHPKQDNSKEAGS